MNLAVDVISDVICPWCYIGKKLPGWMGVIAPVPAIMRPLTSFSSL
jgi:hypothetical protein